MWDWDGFFVGTVLGFILGMLVLGFFITITEYNKSNTEELGSAICEQVYDLQFVSYEDKKLTCKEPDKEFDGIKVSIKEDE